MSNDTQTISLLGKQFHIKHPIEDHANLAQAALYLDEVLHTVRQTSEKVSSFENALVTAALNLSDELLRLKNGSLQPYADIHERMRVLTLSMAEVFLQIPAPLATEDAIY
jgi:cell division protein ZapA (FtsZ GTPase activity inhibitor)